VFKVSSGTCHILPIHIFILVTQKRRMMTSTVRKRGTSTHQSRSSQTQSTTLTNRAKLIWPQTVIEQSVT